MVHCRYLVFLLLLVMIPVTSFADGIPLIDAHSQFAPGVEHEKVISLMDQAGVSVSILASRGKGRSRDLDWFKEHHPDRVVLAARLKGKPYMENDVEYYGRARKQAEHPYVGAIGEALIYHAKKNSAPEVLVYPDERQVIFALELCRQQGWPLIAHIEFAAAGDKAGELMAKFEDMLRSNPDHPFALIHMGQLGPAEVARLLGEHDNVHFMTSHCNPINNAVSNHPWVNLFTGENLSLAWKEIMLQYPDRFIFAIDNVEPEDWGSRYLQQVALWKSALAGLPPEVAHMIGHGNAERLWNIKPVQ